MEEQSRARPTMDEFIAKLQIPRRRAAYLVNVKIPRGAPSESSIFNQKPLTFLSRDKKRTSELNLKETRRKVIRFPILDAEKAIMAKFVQRT